MFTYMKTRTASARPDIDLGCKRGNLIQGAGRQHQGGLLRITAGWIVCLPGCQIFVANCYVAQ